eukprot:CAMPEP_0170615718 /NCGR_PEP_ID=MMETSP0224-20130122/25491_1 /TAXON_ID=285029 /ORGANISM="Togula jolla, Strain CCCM 725" /LENGTH=93 /DNA_ID=CAMNT_0010941477 /DNA_START=260 /DNA_END=541 /DNA_ORIENTATION=+
MGGNLRHPPPDVSEGLLTRDIKHEDDAVSATVVLLGNRRETLLPSSVPDLQFHPLTAPLKHLHPEVNTYRLHHGILHEAILGKLQEQAGLPNA